MSDVVTAGDDLEESAGSASTDEALESPPLAARKRRHRRPPATEKEWYSKAEAARYLGVAEITVTRYLARGILRAQRLPTPGPRAGSSSPARYNYGRLRIHREELDRYLESVDRHPANAQASQVGWRANERGAEGTPFTMSRMGNEPQGEQEQELARLAQAGDTKALDRLQRDNLIMTREEAALSLGVSWRTIKRYIENGMLRLAGSFRCPDSYTRMHIFRSDVERMLWRDEP